MKASFFKHLNVSQETNLPLGVIEQLQSLEKTVDEMNQSFYDIVSDLEGKYSVHEKEIEILEEKFEKLLKAQNDLSLLINVQGKEIASFTPEKIVEETVKPVLSHKIKKTDPNKEEIIRMKALGMDDYQIAKALNKGVREIKMLADLIKKE